VVVDGYVLIGGRSERMGMDKAAMHYPAGIPMALHIAGVLAAVCGRVALVGRQREPWMGDVELVLDAAPDDDRHPLWGVSAALADAQGDVALVVSCDVPFVTAAALSDLIAASGDAGSVAVGPEGRIHPLIAAYRTAEASRALDLARSGQSATRFAVGCAQVVLEPTVLRNMNRPVDTAR